MKIEVSIGEIVDKLSILQIKKDNITDEVKLENINKEYVYLHEIVFSQLIINSHLKFSIPYFLMAAFISLPDPI